MPSDYTSNLLAYWTFDANSGLDVSGNGHTAVLENGTIYADGSAALGRCVSFDGVDDDVNLGTSLGINNIATLTISAWVFRTVSADYGMFFSQRAADDTSRIEMFSSGSFGGNNDDFQIAMCNGAGNSEAYTSNGAYTNNVWHHVVVVYDGGQPTDITKLKFFVDNVQQTLTFTGSIPTTTPNIPATNSYLGRRLDLTGIGTYTGKVDSARLYSRALTAADISALYTYESTVSRGSNCASAFMGASLTVYG